MNRNLAARCFATAAAALAFFAFSGLTALPAAAATVSFVIDDITYTADDEVVGDGATVTDYSGAGGSITIPAAVANGSETYAVTAIGTDAFKSKGITAVSLPDSLISIGSGAFQADSIDTVTIPNSVTSISAYAFYGNGLSTVVLPDTLASIGNNAFGDNDLTAVTLPSFLTQINGYAFQFNQITVVAIPDGVTIIQTGAFRGNALSSVTIPENVTFIGDIAFAENPSLTSVTMEGDAPTITAAGDLGSFGSGEGLIVHCGAEFSDAYQSPWHGYATDAIPTTSASGSLANTGFDVTGGLVGAGTLLTVGIAITLLRGERRKRTTAL